MTNITWDPKITLGNVLTVIAMLTALLGGYINLKLDVAASSEAIADVQAQVDPVDSLITRMALVERNQVAGREERAKFQERTELILDELRKQNIEILKAVARLEAKVSP